MKYQIFLFFSAILLVSGEKTEIPEDVGKGEKLIQSVLKAVEMKNDKMIGEQFEDDFVYKACKKDYNKEESIKMINSIGFEMASIMERNSQIVSVGNQKFLINISNGAIISEFLVSKNWKLQSGKTNSC